MLSALLCLVPKMTEEEGDEGELPPLDHGSVLPRRAVVKTASFQNDLEKAIYLNGNYKSIFDNAYELVRSSIIFNLRNITFRLK